MSHQVFVGITQQIVALGAIAAKVESIEDRHQLGKAILHLLSAAELVLVVKIGLIDHALEVIRLGEPTDDLVDLIADLFVALELDHVGEATAFRHLDDGIGFSGVLIGDVLHEQQREDVVLVLRSVHATAKLRH